MDFDDEQMAELAASIKEHGILQPLILTRAEAGRYTLIAGERRWQAAILAGLERVPASVREASQQDLIELALVEMCNEKT
jgi:ParB family chromosome partitioning protein